MRNIVLFDTSIGSTNIGDQIIMSAVKEEICDIFSEDFIVNLPTHDKIGKEGNKIVKNSAISIVGGTNLLSSNMNYYNQWKINIFSSFYLKNAILLGVGWWQYQKNPNMYTKILLNSVLDTEHIHSVRDNYTKKMLESIGITNAINTGCPTLWKLNQEHCNKIPTQKGKNVIFTLTDYNKDPLRDSMLIDSLCNNYTDVYFWPQGIGDLTYLNQIHKNRRKIKIISPNLSAFDMFLREGKSLDYVGTRLHAGLRAIKYKKRSLILAIDNRASEMKNDFGLNVIDMNEIVELSDVIQKDIPTKLNLPEKEIIKWKRQFFRKECGVPENIIL